MSYDFDKKSSLAFDGNVRYSKSEQGSVTRSELLKNGMVTGGSNGLANTDKKAQSYNFTLEYRYSAPKFFFQTYAYLWQEAEQWG